MPFARVTREPIEAVDAEKLVVGCSHGGICTFQGSVRLESRGRTVSHLEYDAYMPMAEKVLYEIAVEAERKWTVAVAIIHRIARIPVGEISVIVAVGSAHRPEAFEACRFCIDTLKRDAPIWKREVCTDGAYWIEGDRAVEAQG